MFQRARRLTKAITNFARLSKSDGLSIKDCELVERIKQEKLTYLSTKKLFSLLKTCRLIEKSNIEGSFIEAGCALGGSSILMGLAKNSVRPLYVYDVFGMIPPPSSEDTADVHERYETIRNGKSKGIEGEKYYGYEDDLITLVKANLLKFNLVCNRDSVYLIKGTVQETMSISSPVALAHIDVDWYDPVKTCLTRIFPFLAVGGSMIVDDYYSWGGAKKATDEFLATIPNQFVADDSSRSLRITRL
jgi:hypothetical protein